jgi:acetoin utilization deacetylase AcuC-like enzyme
MKIITDERCAEYSAPGHPEKPFRVLRTIEKLRAQTELPITWAAPGEASDVSILRAHSRAHLDRLHQSGDFDADTPNYPDIAWHARRSVGAAIEAMRCAKAGEKVFSLMRPPGHHATSDISMGFCYLNNIAIAVLEALELGCQRVAVFDFDVHHGNGTESILLYHPHTAFFSIHQHPCYPGTGEFNVGDNCFNYPVTPLSTREDYRRTLSRALVDVKNYHPDLIAVSAGFDAYARDPLADGSLEAEDFHWLGQSLAQMNVPMFSLLEGGYSKDLPELIFAYLKGVEGLESATGV